MRIAQIAPLCESVPPRQYGGTERVISYLTEALVRLGHEVTLFASGDSTTAARLEAVWPHALRVKQELYQDLSTHLLLNVLLIERVYTLAHNFDLIHSHLDLSGFPLTRRCKVPVLTTLHGRLDVPALQTLLGEFTEAPLISISDAQRRPVPWANWQATIHHGLPVDLYTVRPELGQYLAFLGRLAPEKRPEHAIEVAKRVGIPLRIAAKLDPADRQYFHHVIEPLLSDPFVEYVGEITDAEKNDFLRNAYALLAPFDWPEPFGLVLIEALACGTPVIAYRRGSIPEIIEHGVTGFVCENLEEMIEAVAHIPLISRKRCRAAFEERFSVDRMVQDYLHVYQKLLAAIPSPRSQKHPSPTTRHAEKIGSL